MNTVAVNLVSQWRRLHAELPEGWREARLTLAVDGEAQLARAAALLGPANPGRAAGGLVLATRRGGGAVGPDALERLLRRLDGEGIRGTLALAGGAEAAGPEPELAAGATLAAAWETVLAGLPRDWSDLLCEVEVSSSDYMQRAALLLSPVNPTREPARSAFRFRVAHRFGYGASAAMVRRCLERLDADGIRGGVRVLRALSDTHNVATQGPVWYVRGKAV